MDQFEESPSLQKSASALKKPVVIIIAGPTAVGKTQVSLDVASLLNGVVLSADSMQVYRGADIGTSKVPLEIRREIPHELIDICEISQAFNVVDFYREATMALDRALSAGRVPIVTGGTGFYIDTLLKGPPEGPPPDSALRAKIEQECDHLGVDLFYEELKKRDPLYAATISHNDRQKMVRAFEIMIQTGKKVSDIGRKGASERAELYDFQCWFLIDDKARLYARIEERCERMVEEGFLEEVRSLIESGLLENLSARKAIGYKQAIEFLDSSRTPDDYARFLYEFKKATRHYAKRQMTWFRQRKEFTWIDLSKNSIQEAARMIAGFNR